MLLNVVKLMTRVFTILGIFEKGEKERSFMRGWERGGIMKGYMLLAEGGVHMKTPR